MVSGWGDRIRLVLFYLVNQKRQAIARDGAKFGQCSLQKTLHEAGQALDRRTRRDSKTRRSAFPESLGEIDARPQRHVSRRGHSLLKARG